MQPGLWQTPCGEVQDALEGRKVLDFLLAYLDRRGSWTSGDGMLDATLGSLRKACAPAPVHGAVLHQYPLTSVR